MKKFFAIALLGLTAFNAVPQYTFAADAATVRTLAREEQVNALFALLQDSAVISDATLRPAGLQGMTEEQVGQFIVKLRTALRTVEGDEAKKAIIRAVLTKQAEPSFMARHSLAIAAVAGALAYIIADLTVIGERGKIDGHEVAASRLYQVWQWMQNKWYGNPGTAPDLSDPTNNGTIITNSSSIGTPTAAPAPKGTPLSGQTRIAPASEPFTGLVVSGPVVDHGCPDATVCPRGVAPTHDATGIATAEELDALHDRLITEDMPAATVTPTPAPTTAVQKEPVIIKLSCAVPGAEPRLRPVDDLIVSGDSCVIKKDEVEATLRQLKEAGYTAEQGRSLFAKGLALLTGFGRQ